MYSLCILVIASCLFSLLLTPLVRDWSVQIGLVDRPDHARKIHATATARTGGVSILLSYTGAYAVLLLLPLTGGRLIGGNLGMIQELLPPVALVFITGLLDDWLNFKPWQKLGGELAAGIWAYTAGVRILGFAGHEIPAWCSLLLTVGWLVLCTNAFNLMDGIDGLAAGVGLTVTTTMLIAGLLHRDTMLAFAMAPLAGCLIGFLRYNFNRASIFLGDSGSLLIGFLLGAYGVIWSQKAATMPGVAAPAMALALPLLEVCLSVVRRFLTNEPIFLGDRRHIHHQLLDRGFTPRKTALLLYGACGVGAALSLLQSVMPNRLSAVAILLLAAAAWVGVRYLGYAEFEAARRFVWGGFRPALSARVKLELLERSLLSATSVGQCWDTLQLAAQSLGYSHLNARLGGARFSNAPDPDPSCACWQIRLNLPGNDYVNITQCEANPRRPVLVIPFVEVARRILPEKLEQLAAETGSAGIEPRSQRPNASAGDDRRDLRRLTPAVQSGDWEAAPCAAPGSKTR